MLKHREKLKNQQMLKAGLKYRCPIGYRYRCTIQFGPLVFVTGGYAHAALASAGILKLLSAAIFFLRQPVYAECLISTSTQHAVAQKPRVQAVQ